jgi:transposase
MLRPGPPPLSEFDQQVFQAIVPNDHYLRQVRAVIDFEKLRPRLVGSYSLTMGCPAIDPVRMLKILFLRFHYRLSDRQVMERTKTDMAFRWFLDFGVHDKVPNHTNGTHFRQRLSVAGFEQVFQEVVAQAREHGLVKDRLRLKDATHMFAAVADVRPLQLAAQVREHVLRAAEPLFAEWVSQQRSQVEILRQTTAELPDDERLAQRIEQLRQMTRALQQRCADLPSATDKDAQPRQRLQRALAVAAKLLSDRAAPKAGDRLASGVDADARWGKHGDYYVGYLLDVAMDADSELITSVNVLPANGDEGADVTHLIEQEEQAHGNDVEAVSMDGAGFRGELLRELTDPQGLNMQVFVPPAPEQANGQFQPEQFTLSADGASLTCPAGQTTTWRDEAFANSARFTFPESACANCPLRQQCLAKPTVKRRTVVKNYYEAEYRAARAKAKTAAYAEVRRQHPAIERKLSELVRRHDARHARFWGLERVLRQGIMTALVVNLKRIVRLMAERLTHAVDPPLSTGIVRAELAKAG